MLSPLSPIVCGGIGVIIPTVGDGDILIMVGAASMVAGVGDGDITIIITMREAGIPDIIGVIITGGEVVYIPTDVRMVTAYLLAIA